MHWLLLAEISGPPSMVWLSGRAQRCWAWVLWFGSGRGWRPGSAMRRIWRDLLIIRTKFPLEFALYFPKRSLDSSVSAPPHHLSNPPSCHFESSSLSQLPLLQKVVVLPSQESDVPRLGPAPHSTVELRDKGKLRPPLRQSGAAVYGGDSNPHPDEGINHKEAR